VAEAGVAADLEEEALEVAAVDSEALVVEVVVAAEPVGVGSLDYL
jgi:hypothetical protein